MWSRATKAGSLLAGGLKVFLSRKTRSSRSPSPSWTRAKIGLGRVTRFVTRPRPIFARAKMAPAIANSAFSAIKTASNRLQAGYKSWWLTVLSVKYFIIIVHSKTCYLNFRDWIHVFVLSEIQRPRSILVISLFCFTFPSLLGGDNWGMGHNYAPSYELPVRLRTFPRPPLAPGNERVNAEHPATFCQTTLFLKLKPN